MHESHFHIIGEFKENDIDTGLKHARGALSMGRDSDHNSAGTQFFVVHQDAFRLDGKYAAFGMLLDGFDVLDRIAETEVGPPEKENRPIKMQKIKEIRVNTNGVKLEVQRLP